jgi:hypothetical protein
MLLSLSIPGCNGDSKRLRASNGICMVLTPMRHESIDGVETLRPQPYCLFNRRLMIVSDPFDDIAYGLLVEVDRKL